VLKNSLIPEVVPLLFVRWLALANLDPPKCKEHWVASFQAVAEPFWHQCDSIISLATPESYWKVFRRAGNVTQSHEMRSMWNQTNGQPNMT
jgi:hypothetical protein